MTLTEEQIAEIRARVEAATPGPWDTIGGSRVRAVKGDMACPIFSSEAPIDWHKNKRITHPVLCRAYADQVNNATFIAHAREDIPALLSALEAQAAELAEVRQQYVDANEARIDAETQLAEARKALRGLLEPFEDDDCRYDHHGYCQAHFLQEGDECCVEIARRVYEGGR